MGYRAATLAVVTGIALAAPCARADDVGISAAPIAAVPLLALLGGIATTVMLADDLAGCESTLPAVRDTGLAFGVANVVLGSVGLVATAFVDDEEFRPIGYSVSGVIVALGLAGGTLSLLSHPAAGGGDVAAPPVAISVGPSGATAAWRGRF